jgi:lipoate-protein ligase A
LVIGAWSLVISAIVNFRLIIDRPAPGAWNMAVDEVLLLDAAENGTATLRLYGWSEPTLSLGYFQRYADREKHPASCGCAIVRRQTGGGAILHDRELTYSLVLPETHVLARHTGQLYRTMHQAFIETLSTTNSPTPNWRLQLRNAESQLAPDDEPFLCFQRQSQGDLVLLSAAEQHVCKILGSAQRRYHGAVLQHGSLLLERSPAAPELAGLRDLSNLNVAAETVAAAVTNRLENVLGTRLLATTLPPELQSKAEELANNKYGSPAWTKRR